MSKVPLLDQARAIIKILWARDEFSAAERSDRVRFVANNKNRVLWFLVKRTLIPLNCTTGPTVAEKPRVEGGAKFVRDGLGDTNNFVEDVFGGRTIMVHSIGAEDGNDCVVIHLIRTKVGTAKRTVVRDDRDRLNKWQRAHTVGNVKRAAGWGSLAGNRSAYNELG